MSDSIQRRLAAIVAVDVAEYSRLVRKDEEETLRALRAHRQDFTDPLIGQFGGRIANTAGDSLLLEFPSAVEAVRCALALQAGMVERNSSMDPDRRINFRIGINVGDVVAEGDDLLGDGVNVAARLEAQAEPGGICLSRAARDQVRDQLDLELEDLGEVEVKNIDRPVRTFKVVLEDKPAAIVAPVARKVAGPSPRWWSVAASAVAVLTIAVVSVVWWQPWAPDVEPVSIERAALTPANKPSIAVLPFVNISGDDEQEYFADGMTEDLITDLSKISNLTVISRTSTFSYKGQEVDVREIGKALNVRYVIEGSVRKVGEQIRINAQLVDANTGGHLWAERYDGVLSNIFGLQDQVLEQIVSSLALQLSGPERQRLADKGTDSVEAHDLYLRGLFLESTFTREGNEEAMSLYEQALSIDPNYALPYTRISNILQMNTDNGWSNDIQADLNTAVELAQKAATLDPQNPYVHWSLGRASSRLMTSEALERGIKALEMAIELDPNYADAYAFLTILYVADGRAEDGFSSIETAMQLNPRYPFWYLFMRGIAHYVVEDYATAIADFEAAAERSPTAPFVRWWLAASYAQAGRADDAEWEIEELHAMGFEGTIATLVDSGPILDDEYVSLYKQGLRKAGLPE